MFRFDRNTFWAAAAAVALAATAGESSAQDIVKALPTAAGPTYILGKDRVVTRMFGNEYAPITGNDIADIREVEGTVWALTTGGEVRQWKDRQWTVVPANLAASKFGGMAGAGLTQSVARAYVSEAIKPAEKTEWVPVERTREWEVRTPLGGYKETVKEVPKEDGTKDTGKTDKGAGNKDKAGPEKGLEKNPGNKDKAGPGDREKAGKK